jgi:tripartite-type tricarboxylate transporter receptor subunit TctC
MKTRTQRHLRYALMIASILPCAARAADVYPMKPIRLLHGYGAGSSMDTNARTIGQKLAEYFGHPVVVELRPGATGTIAAELVAASPRDGYTLLAAPGSSLAATPHLQQVRFNPLRDFAPVAIIGDFSYLLAAHPGVPARNVKELVALAKSRPRALTYGSNGTGSAYHFAGELLKMMAGIDMLHVPYKGGGTSAAIDLMTGRIDLMWNNPVFLLPQVRAGKLRAIAVTGAARVPAMADVPTIAETIKGYEISGWQGIVAPAGTPADVISKLASSTERALASPDIKAQWNERVMEAAPSTPDVFAKRLRADYERYGALVQRLGKIE